MSNKDLQEQRMKGYFIQATKDILKGEGIRNISVRNISERAGYSFATLYNYFKDVKELIFLCVKDFQDECQVHINNRTISNEHGIAKIKSISNAYIEYFIQYPGIFELFYIERLSEIGSSIETSEQIISFLDRLCNEEFYLLIKNNEINLESSLIMKSNLNNSIVGLLILYLNRRYPQTYQEFISNSNKLIDNILSI